MRRLLVRLIAWVLNIHFIMDGDGDPGVSIMGIPVIFHKGSLIVLRRKSFRRRLKAYHEISPGIWDSEDVKI